MTYKRLPGAPFGAVISDDKPVRLPDGSIVRSYYDAFESETSVLYERVIRPSGRVEWFQVTEDEQ